MKQIAKMATHVPLLVRAFDVSEGDVLEVGTGYFSTTILDWLCSISGRKMVSYETDQGWFDRAKRMQSDYHDVIFVENWSDVPMDQKQWGLAFIDHDPHKDRATSIERLVDHADFIVAHDTEPRSEQGYNYPRIYSLFKYRFDDNRVEPWTSVFSNKFELKELFGYE